jgi:hypothetical protein
VFPLIVVRWLMPSNCSLYVCVPLIFDMRLMLSTCSLYVSVCSVNFCQEAYDISFLSVCLCVLP